MQTNRPIRRKLGPAIAWHPTHDDYHVVARILRHAAGTPPIYLAQQAILELEARIRDDSSPIPFGILAGAFCISDRESQEYLVVDEVVPAQASLDSTDPIAELTTALRSLGATVEKRKKVVVGWYLGGMEDDLAMDPEALNLHRILFPERWQIVLLRNEPTHADQGGLFRFEPMTDRLYPIPFAELLPGALKRGEQKERRTAIRWHNYVASEPVVPLGAAAVVVEAGARSSRPRSNGGASADSWTRALRWAQTHLGRGSSEPSLLPRPEHRPTNTTPRDMGVAAELVAVPERAPARPDASDADAGSKLVVADARRRTEVAALPGENESTTVDRPAELPRVQFPALLPDDREAPHQRSRWRVMLLSSVVLLAALVLYAVLR